METGQSTASDGNEDERNHRTAHNRAAAVDEFGDGGHLELGHHKKNAKSKSQNRPDLQEGRQIVTRQQQQPDRKHRSKEAVDRDQHRHRLAINVKESEVFGVRSNPRARKDAQEQQHHAQKRCAENVALTPNLQVQTHDDGDRNRCDNRVGRPQRVMHGVHASNR